MSFDRQSGTIRKTNPLEPDADSIQAILLPFSNDPQPKTKTLPVQDLKARITYYKGDEVYEYKRIDSGCWLGQRYPYIALEVGGIAYLIAALSFGGEGAVAVEAAVPSLIFNESSMSGAQLPTGRYQLKVSLMAGEHGEYYGDFWFELEVGEQPGCKRIMPR